MNECVEINIYFGLNRILMKQQYNRTTITNNIIANIQISPNYTCDKLNIKGGGRRRSRKRRREV